MTWTGIYLGIDPGLRTGACLLAVSGDSILLAFHWDIPGGAEGFIEWWNQHVPKRQDGMLPATCVYESFTLREGKYGVDITPRDVIGALKALANRDGVDLIERPPAARKRQVPDEVLRRMGLYLAGEPNRNAREAVRHVVAYLKSQKHPRVLEAFQ